VKIRLNGDPFEIDSPLSIADLKIDPRRVAVEHNLDIIKRARYDTTIINEGDEVEIVNFVGGG
jgi:sulfur carrier protein